MTIPVSYSTEKKFDSQPDSIKLAIEKALTSLGWEYDQTVSGSFKGHIGMSFWSWGENFTITPSPDGTVRMKSVCSFPLTLVSWGKNKRNVNKFFAALNNALNVTE
jgi:hypothetical protein